jgi:hypothetical protein
MTLKSQQTFFIIGSLYSTCNFLSKSPCKLVAEQCSRTLDPVLFLTHASGSGISFFWIPDLGSQALDLTHSVLLRA